MTLPDWMKPQNAGNPHSRVHPQNPHSRVNAGNAHPPNPRTRMTHTRARLGFTLTQMAKYLGVPVRTYIKWENGTRAPVAVVTRLLDILDMMQANAPALHDELLKQARHK